MVMTMANGTYRFEIGKFQCTAVSDGTLTYAPPTFPPPAALLFANASREELEETLRDHKLQPEQWVEWTSPYICLVVDAPECRVLVDTGADGLAPTTGKLQENLKAEGISSEEIDMVLLTHGHPDHIGGNTDADGKPAFPNARFVIRKDEWDFWTSGQADEQLDEHVKDLLVSFARKNLPPIQDRVDLIEDETQIIPGIRAISAGGHTPGHMALEISSESGKLLCVSDAVLHPIHLEQPEWYAAVDFAPEQAVSTRRRLLDRAATEKALVLAFHFPFPGIGRVIQRGKAWHWQPIAI
jgi:glyoxylase-like metal-dependent hydrolase (beta-lactamase superfamily II)